MKRKCPTYQKQNRRVIVIALGVAWLLGMIAILADSADADTMPTEAPTFEQMMVEPALIGNDLTFANVTPDSLQVIIDAELALYPSSVSTSDEYQANFYADGSAFMFRVPAGTGVDVITQAPEPSSIALALAGLVLVLWRWRARRRQNGEYLDPNALYALRELIAEKIHEVRKRL